MTLLCGPSSFNSAVYQTTATYSFDPFEHNADFCSQPLGITSITRTSPKLAGDKSQRLVSGKSGDVSEKSVWRNLAFNKQRKSFVSISTANTCHTCATCALQRSREIKYLESFASKTLYIFSTPMWHRSWTRIGFIHGLDWNGLDLIGLGRFVGGIAWTGLDSVRRPLIASKV